MIDNITTATPAEIDTLWAELSEKLSIASMHAQRQRKIAEDYADKGFDGHSDEHGAKALEYVEQMDKARAAIAPLVAEWKRRGGWARAFLVCNTNGHVHKDRNCSSCFPQTRYAWMTEFSGLDEAEIVDAAGERACTVCYPSAPVEVLSKPTRMFTPDEKKAQAARAEREAKRAAKEAAKVVDPATGKVLFNTERAAFNAMLQANGDLLWYGSTHPSAGKWSTTLIVTATALEARLGRKQFDILEEVRTKARKKYNAEAKKAYESVMAQLGVWRSPRSSEPHHMEDPNNWMFGLREWAKANGKI